MDESFSSNCLPKVVRAFSLLLRELHQICENNLSVSHFLQSKSLIHMNTVGEQNFANLDSGLQNPSDSHQYPSRRSRAAHVLVAVNAERIMECLNAIVKSFYGVCSDLE